MIKENFFFELKKIILEGKWVEIQGFQSKKFYIIPTMSINYDYKWLMNVLNTNKFKLNFEISKIDINFALNTYNAKNYHQKVNIIKNKLLSFHFGEIIITLNKLEDAKLVKGFICNKKKVTFGRVDPNFIKKLDI